MSYTWRKHLRNNLEEKKRTSMKNYHIKEESSSSLGEKYKLIKMEKLIF